MTSVWTSHDGGASWTEVERLEGVPDDPNTIMLTDGAVTFAAIAGTDADGAVRTALVQISPDGDGVVVGERRWPGAESAAVFGVERSSDTIITVVAVHDGDTHVPHVILADLVDAHQDAIDLRSVAGLRSVFGLVDIDDSAFAVGVAQTDDDYQPALVKITP